MNGTGQPKQLSESIYVLDLETTGLEGYPQDKILEVAIYRINRDLSIDHVFDTLIHHPIGCAAQINNCWWANHAGISYDDTMAGMEPSEAWKHLKLHLDGEQVVSYNVGYDFGLFLKPMQSPQNLLSGSFDRIDYTILPDPMWISSRHLKLKNRHGGRKWPRLEEAANFYHVSLHGQQNFHRADYDTHLTASLLVTMIKKGDYQVSWEGSTSTGIP